MDNQTCDVRIDFLYFDSTMDSIQYVCLSSLFTHHTIETPDSFDLNAIHTEKGRIEAALQMAGFKFDEFRFSMVNHSSARSTIVYNVTLIRKNRDVFSTLSAVQSALS